MRPRSSLGFGSIRLFAPVELAALPPICPGCILDQLRHVRSFSLGACVACDIRFAFAHLGSWPYSSDLACPHFNDSVWHGGVGAKQVRSWIMLVDDHVDKTVNEIQSYWDSNIQPASASMVTASLGRRSMSSLGRQSISSLGRKSISGSA